MEDIVTQIEINNPNYFVECYCDTNNNSILDPLELQFLDWEYSNSDEMYFLKGLSLTFGSQFIDSIPSSIQNVQSLINLRIIHSSISTIPMEIFSLQNLEILDLSQNTLTSLPDFFIELDESIRIINFSENDLVELPASIFQLENVELINVNNNLISSLPEDVCTLGDETVFSISQNSLCNRDFVPNCFEEEVSFQTNCYSELDIMGIEALIDSNNITIEDCDCDLNLNGNVDAFEFGELLWQPWTENARLIEAKFSNINTIPKVTFNSIDDIEKLNLSNNFIDTIFNEIENLTSLIELDLSNNNLPSLPEGMVNLLELKELTINGNDSLSYIPNLFQLDELNISHTNLFCENGIYNENELNEYLVNGVLVNGAFMQYCYMQPDIDFIKDMIEFNSYFTDWQNTGVQNWSEGRLTGFTINDQVNTNEIPLSVSNLTEVEYFEVSNTLLSEIPIEIEELDNLSSLILNNNNLDTLAIDFSQLIELQLLNISSNDLHQFPESVCEIPLIEVNFEDNRICDEINPPCTVFQWDQQLQTQRCKNLEDISFILDLKSQNNMAGEYFSIGHQVWSEIENESLDRLVLFEHIGGQNSNDTIYSLPVVISSVVFLQELNLINHSIETIPTEVFSLSELAHLNLSSNKINDFPIINDQNNSLLSLDLSHNELVNISDEIANLTQLNSFDLSYNSFQELPYTIGNLYQLTELNFSNNDINSIPENLENLTSLGALDISSNEIDSLPEIWCNQLQLDWNNPNQFNADDNKLCDESKIPSCITVNEINQNCD